MQGKAGESVAHLFRERTVPSWAEAVTLVATSDQPGASYEDVRAQFDE